MVHDPSSLSPHLERALRAVLVVDVVESVRLMEQDEDAAVVRWLKLAAAIESEVVSGLGGHLVKRLGDGLLIEFADVRGAASAAFAIQEIAERFNAPMPAEERLLLRMGIEISDVIRDHGDIYGRGVNLASRLTSLAGPSEIVVSARAREQLTPVLDAEIEDLGDCYVKHVRLPVRAYRIGRPGPRPVVERASAAEPLLPSLAIVPFTSRTPGLADDHNLLGEVLAEEMIRQLSHSAEINVISRLSTTAFRGRDTSLADIGAHLGADYVLSGTYRADDQQIRLDIELADAGSGHVVWMERLSDHIAGLVGGEQELISRVVVEVAAQILSRELRRARSQSLPTLRSYTLMMSGIAAMHRLSMSDFDRARGFLQALIERAPRQAIPRAWLAKWHVLRVQQGWSPDPHLDAREASQCTMRALDIDPLCSLALAMDGFVHTNLLKRLDVAQERYDLAISTNPNDPNAWLLRGTLQAFKGNGAAAVRDTRRALMLSPLDPHRFFFESLAATAHLAARDYAGARDLAQSSLRANRTHTSTLRALAIAQWQLGEHAAARQTGAELMRLEPRLTIGTWRDRSPSSDYAIGTEWADALQQSGVPR